MLAHAEDSDAFSLYFPHSFSILLPSFRRYVICPWQFYLYVVYQRTLPGLIHSSFFQEDGDVFFAEIEQMCSFILPPHQEISKIQEKSSNTVRKKYIIYG